MRLSSFVLPLRAAGLFVAVVQRLPNISSNLGFFFFYKTSGSLLSLNRQCWIRFVNLFPAFFCALLLRVLSPGYLSLFLCSLRQILSKKTHPLLLRRACTSLSPVNPPPPTPLRFPIFRLFFFFQQHHTTPVLDDFFLVTLHNSLFFRTPFFPSQALCFELAPQPSLKLSLSTRSRRRVLFAFFFCSGKHFASLPIRELFLV